MTSFKINLTYFKPTGNFYTQGSFHSSKLSMYEIANEVRDMRSQGSLPGLRAGVGVTYFIHINSKNHPYAFPVLILPE